MNLAPYAANHLSSIGRQYVEPASRLRNEFQRDRDRIIHSTSFRRLQYKTQVFVSHEGDMFRNRLTHSLEVSQVSRGIARTLGCHEDLAEAIALGHDLGHTPFGHAGQDALNDCMKNFGGFEHNLQSLRVVDLLESKYPSFRGLNLTYETREGILKHCSNKNARQLGRLGQRFLQKSQPSLEAQIVNFADEIAYYYHDIDDGYRSEILSLKMLREINLFNKFYLENKKKYPKSSEEKIVYESIRNMMHCIINDLCKNSLQEIQKNQLASIEEVRLAPALIGYSKNMQKEIAIIKKFSKINIYNHRKILNMSNNAKPIIFKLFEFFQNDFNKVPLEFKQNCNESSERIIADYIAGMTDRFAISLAESF